MSKLFIYYTFTGNGEVVARSMQEKGYELRKVTEKHKMPKSFFFIMMDGGFRAGIGAKGKLVGYDNDVSDYEESTGTDGQAWRSFRSYRKIIRSNPDSYFISF